MLQVSKMQYDKIFSFIESGKQEGAKAILGGEKRPGKGYFVDPTSKPHSVSKHTFLHCLRGSRGA